MLPNLDTFITLIWIAAVFGLGYWFYITYKSNNEEVENHYEMGLKYIIEKKNRKAIEKLKEAIRYDSSNIDAYVKLGDLLREEGALKQAYKVHKDLILRAEISNEDKLNVLQSISQDLIKLKNEDQAVRFLKQIIELQNDNQYALNELLRIYENKGQFKDAFDLIHKIEDTLIDDKMTRLAMYKVLEGLNHVEQNKEKDARILFKEALKYDAKCEAAYILIGDSYIREDREDNAIEKWLECASEIPSKAHFLFERLEKAWFDSGEFYKLEDFYRSMVQKKPANVKALIALTEILVKKGEFKQAIDVCKEYLKSDSDNELVIAHLAEYLIANKNQKQANDLIIRYFQEKFENYLETYQCTVCNNIADEPLGKCPKCGSWSSYT